MKLVLLASFAAFVIPRAAAVIPLSSIDLSASSLTTDYIVELSSSSGLSDLENSVQRKRTSSVGYFLPFLISRD